MPVPASLGQLSQTASMNSPAGGENVFPDQDDYERQQFANDAILRDGAHQWLTGVSGTNTVTGSTAASSAVSAYAAGQVFRFVAAGANTGAVTLNVNGLGAKTVTKRGATALAAGDIAAGSVVTVTYDGTQFQMLDPADAVQTGGNQTVAGVKTFSAAPKSSVAASASDELVRKGEMDAALFGRLLKVRLFTFADNGSTYVPTAGTSQVLVYAQGAGGSSGSLPATGSGQWAAAQGAASGACAVNIFPVASIGTGVVMTIGQSVAPAVGSPGITGGTTSFGALMSATGGLGSGAPGVISSSVEPASASQPAGTSVTGALWAHYGLPGGRLTGVRNSFIAAGDGAASYFGVGGIGPTSSTGLSPAPGSSGQGYGQGASGGSTGSFGPAFAGVKGGDGCILVFEYA